jgi:short-subunit dehydrogenase
MINKRLAWLGIGLAGILGARKILHKKAESRYDFRRKVVFISGASRGLGLVLARQLAAQHARLAICARNEHELERAKKQLQEEYAAEVIALPCDVSDKEQVQEVMDKVAAHYGRLDVLINNAGQIIISPLRNNELADFEQLMQVHFYGTLNCVHAALPHLRRQPEGRIVNISSIGGKLSVPHLLPYSASKFAVSGLSEGLRAALHKENIQVTTVYPGLMRTGSPRNVEVKGLYEKEYKWFKISDSLPGISVNAEQAAGQILRACQRGAASLTISLPAKLAVAVSGLFPGLVVEVNALVNRILPEAGESNKSIRGYETAFEHKKSWITGLTDKSARENLNILSDTGLEK